MICYQPGLKTGMDFRGQVRKWVSVITCIFWSKIVLVIRYIHANPYQEFPGIPPPPGHEDIAVLGQFCAEVMDHFTFL